MKQILFFFLLLSTFVAKAEFQTCKMFIGSGAIKDQDKSIHQIIQNYFVELDISGYTLYSAQGAWRPDKTAQYQVEPATVVEIIAKNADVPHLHMLVLELETQLKQKDVLYYCQDIKAASFTAP